MSSVFLYRVKDSNDRDCCAYIENRPMRFECDHYFGRVAIHGSCYWGGEFANYDEIETVLSREEYQALIDFSKAIDQLGCCIERGDERYQKGLNLCADVQHVYDKLKSDEAREFFNKIWQSEKEFLMNEYDLDEDDIEDILDNYCCEYLDRSIVGCVFDSVKECGEEEAYSLGYVQRNTVVERYFDFEKFGEDLLEDEPYHELNDGRVVYLNC